MNTVKHPLVCHTCGASFPTQRDHLLHRWAAHSDAGAKALHDNLGYKHKKEADPLVTSIMKVRREWRKTQPGMLQTLLDEQSRWKRKLTIAQNKLAAVRDDIDKFAAELAKERTENK